MVASKTKKVMKYTYTERVLGSFSLIQREHKKHAIHLASLRAQVQKTANARNDRLGPHWKNWVGKAVHRLEEDGILASSEPPGTVALTPNGKKAISAARRSLALPTNDTLSPAQEDLLWKQVTHQAPAPVVKRMRQRPSDSEDDSDDDEPEYVPPKSRKRARTSLAASKNGGDPAFKLTKAQLVEELTVLRRAREADRLRAASPLTELDDDESEEFMRLKEVLKHREEEIHLLQRQLANQHSDAPDPFDVTMSSPLHPIAVIRTQSGSFINHLSKQPTPAPTEHDSDYNDDSMFDAPDPDPASVLPSSSSFVHTLVTPEATPSKNTPKARALQSNKVSSLEHALQLRAAELQTLEHKLQDPEHKLSELNAQHARSQLVLADKDTRISILQTNLDSYERQISEKYIRVSDLERAKADLEASVAEKVANFERLVRERQSLKSEHERLKTERERELSRLRQDLSDSELAVAARVAESESARVDATSRDAEFRRERDVQVAACTRLEAELAEQNAAADEAKQAFLARVAGLELRVEEQGAAKEEAARVSAELAAASKSLAVSEAQNADLAAQLKDASEKLSAAQGGLADAHAAAEALRPQMAALDEALTARIAGQREVQERLGRTQREADTLRLKISILETTLGGVRGELEGKKQEVERLEQELAARAEANSALAGEVREQEQRLAQAGEANAALQTTLEETRLELQHARHAEAEVREAREVLAGQLAEVTTARVSLIAELAAAVQEIADKMRNAEVAEMGLKGDAAVKDQELEQLRVQVGESVDRIREVEQALHAAEAKYVAEIAGRESARVALEDALEAARGEVERLAEESATARREGEEVRGRLEGDVRRIGDALAAATRRGDLIEVERAEAVARVREVEGELLELQASKHADADTIQELKNVFSQLKSAQLESFAQMDDKVESAQASPVPRRRASKVPVRSA
ncbi:hypothetical protein DFH09DRAFT_1360291 [Mycena vulgaris]|nr:hypothetical protein DFH09DRAFT_1360291 [Mycena vulgaris]